MLESEGQVKEQPPGFAVEEFGSEDYPSQFDALTPLAQFVGLLFSPSKTFESVVRKRNWFVPLLISMVIPCAVFSFFVLQGKEGLERAIREDISVKATRDGKPTGGTEIDRQVVLAKNYAIWGGGIFVFISPLFFAFVTAAIYSLGLAVLQGIVIYKEVAVTDTGMMLSQIESEDLKLPIKKVCSIIWKQTKDVFNRVLAVVSWSFAVTTVVYLVTSVSVLMMYNKQDLSSIFSKAQINHLPTNLMQVLPSTIPLPIQMLASSIDIFTIWNLFLLSAGFAVITKPFRIPKVRTDLLVVGTWVWWIITKVGVVLMAMLLGPLFFKK